MSEFELEFDNKKAQDFFQKLEKNVSDVIDFDKKYGSVVGVFIFQDVINHFEKQQGPSGAWDGWSERYRARLAKLGKSSNKILQDSGKLRQSFTPENFKKHSNGYYWFNNAKTSSGFPYAAAHDNGGPILKQRSFMWLSDTALDKISQATLSFIMRS